MKNKENKFLGREGQEAKENLESIKKDIPSSRFQGDQQIQDTSSAIRTEAPESSFEKQKVKSKGNVLKQEVASRVVTKGLGGSIPEEVSGRYSLSYSGNEGTVLGSAAYTPVVGQSRSSSRYGKKLDATAKKIDYVASEQVIEHFDESKPLAENPESVQGYNGTYRNENARAQKVSGNVPGELMFQRSVDEIKRDQLYFSTGQLVNTTGAQTQDTPTIVPKLNSLGVYQYPESPNYSLRRGNFHNRAMRIKVNSSGKVTQMIFDTVDLSNNNIDAGIADQASSHAMIDRNYAEMDRQIMDQKAGDEKADLWTPLARAIKQPTQTVGYLRDIENITGSEVFMAYKKTALCHSYQLNRSAKDGIKAYSPMVEAVMGLIMPEVSSEDSASLNIFDPKYYKLGSSALMIDAYDSKSKYNRKSDILLQPRSFKMHMQTADNNMNPLRVKAEFVQTVNAREVFSTIDRDYDPLMPVCISDRASIIHCYDFNELYSFSNLDSLGLPVFKKDPFKYMYSDLRNNYVVTAAIPLLEGIHEYLNSIGSKLYQLCGTDEIVIPMTHSTCFFSLWSLIILAATPFILNNRVNSLRDVLYYEKNVEYPFHQLISIKEANPMNAVNYENSNYQEPIIVKQMLPSAALSWYLPELFWPFDEKASTNDDRYTCLFPWYMNEKNFNFTTTHIEINSAESAMTMPSIRSGARFSFLDNVYSMDERELRLCLDRLVDIPDTIDGTGNQGVYKYSQVSDGIPFATFSSNDFTIQDYLSLPRELGTFIVAPASYLSVKPANTVDDDSIAKFASENDAVFGNTSYIIKFWHGKNALSFDTSTPGDDGKQVILKPTQINVNRSTAYVQDWDSMHAIQHEANDYKDFGWLPSLCDLYQPGTTTPVQGLGSFIPFTNGVDVGNGAQNVYINESGYLIISMQKAIWTRIQKLPFAISPFDTCANYKRAGVEDGIKVDPFDFLYYFGLAGFRASDFREDVYNRLNEIVNQGFTFLSDPFMNASPIYRDAKRYTESTNVDSLVEHK